MPATSDSRRGSVSTFARPEMLASTDWLADQLGHPEVRILDVRWRPDGTALDTFAAGHIPGAAHLDWRKELIEEASEDSGPGLRLATPDRAAGAFGRAGIGDGSTVVIYDDSISLYASRVWWSLRAYGFESARILDGGYPAWHAAALPVSNASFPHAAASFTPRANPRWRLTTSDVRSLLGSPDALLLDARAAAEYRGLEGNARRLGHIPGAVNVPVGAMHRQGTQLLKEPAELREQLHRANVARGKRMICYDGSGVAAAKLAFVLTLLGHDDVAVYDGGWSEWGDRLDLPVDR